MGHEKIQKASSLNHIPQTSDPERSNSSFPVQGKKPPVQSLEQHRQNYRALTPNWLENNPEKHNSAVKEASTATSTQIEPETEAGKSQSESLKSDKQGENQQQTKQGVTLYAQAGRMPSEDLDQYCFDLLQKIKELYKEVKFRYEDLLRDSHQLYRNHRYIDQPHPDYGSWKGHQRKYNQQRAELRRLLKHWHDHCKGDPDLVTYAQADIEDAENYANIPAPESPLAMEQGFRLPDWAIALGVVVVGGAIIIGVTLTLPGWALAALASIAAVAGLRLIDRRI